MAKLLLLLLVISVCSIADTDPRTQTLTWKYNLYMENTKEPILFNDLIFFKVYYWGVNGGFGMKAFSKPLPTQFTTAPCVNGNYRVTVVYKNYQESKFSNALYVNKSNEKGCKL